MHKPVEPSRKKFKTEEDYEDALDVYYHQLDRYYKYLDAQHKEEYLKAKYEGIV